MRKINEKDVALNREVNTKGIIKFHSSRIHQKIKNQLLSIDDQVFQYLSISTQVPS